MPNVLVRLFGRVVEFFAGRCPLVTVVRGKETDDPRIREDILSK